MPVYTLKLRVPIGDVVHVKVDVPDQYHVGQMVRIERTDLVAVRGPDGILAPGPHTSITGTVTGKS